MSGRMVRVQTEHRLAFKWPLDGTASILFDQITGAQRSGEPLDLGPLLGDCIVVTISYGHDDDCWELVANVRGV